MILKLPVDVLALIFVRLDIYSIARASQVCIEWRDVRFVERN